jgi:hypothetical protein
MSDAYTLDAVVNSVPGTQERELGPGLELPRGSYVIFARVHMAMSAAAGLDFRMTLGSAEERIFTWLYYRDVEVAETASLTLWASINRRDRVRFFAKGNGVVASFRIVAIKIDTLHPHTFQQPEAPPPHIPDDR